MIKNEKYFNRESERNKRKIQLESKKIILTNKGNTSIPDNGKIYIKNQGVGSYDLNIKINEDFTSIPLIVNKSKIKRKDDLKILNTGLKKSLIKINYLDLGKISFETFNLGEVDKVKNIAIIFVGGIDFVNKIDPDFFVYVKIGNTGWVSFNDYYTGIGDPYNDNYPALLASYEPNTPSMKGGTFGSIYRSGTLSVKVGRKKRSSKKFTGITFFQF